MMAEPRRVIDDQRYVHFLTFSIDRRRKLLDHDQPKRLLLKTLCEELKAFEAKCVGFALMPEHVHALIWLPKTGKLSQFMHAWKRKSSFQIRNWYREGNAEYFAEASEGDRFWLPKYHAFAIYNPKKLEEKLVYMHENPVRAGYVQNAVDWEWSSARWYADKSDVRVPIEWLQI